MSESNRLRLTWVPDTIGDPLGTTPASPRMREARITSESLRYAPVFTNSEVLRSDRMDDDPTMISTDNNGGINLELTFPPDNSPESDWIESMMCSAWLNTPFRDNDGTADSIITNVANGTDIVTVTAPTGSSPFVTGQLVRNTGFTNAGNNGIFKCTTGSATVPAFVGAGFAAEPAPPAAARMKVIGFEGASGDITAAAGGLASTALDFTTLGLRVGQWIKVGDLADGSTFAFLVTAGAKARRLAWARITAITANALSLDNLPTEWAVDAGTGKSIRVFFGDTIRNGLLTLGGTVERGFMDHSPADYIITRGAVVNQAQFNFPNKEKATVAYTFMAMNGELTQTSLDATPDAASTTQTFAPGVNLKRIAENGVCISTPNYAQSLQISVNNNIRMIEGLACGEEVGPLDMSKGSFGVSVSMPTYFGDPTLLTKLFAGTATNINTRLDKNNQALIFAVPRITFTDGTPNAGGKNQDVMIALTGTASRDPDTNSSFIIDRLEYFR